jgi:polyribonucleotide 5'-hydroxyl-kinase
MLVSSIPASQYSSTTTTQPALVSLHLALESQRILARRYLTGKAPNDGTEPVTRGPRVMVLGPPGSGKTTVVKNLVNMALGSGMGWNVGVIGLDPASVSFVFSNF